MEEKLDVSREAMDAAMSLSEEDTKKYFSPKEWDKLSPYQKQHKTNMLRNYHVKLAIGFLGSELPDFVERAKKREAAFERAEAKKKMKMLNPPQPTSTETSSMAPKPCTATSGAPHKSEETGTVQNTVNEPGTKVVDGYVIPKGCTVISKPRYAKPGTASDAPIIHNQKSTGAVKKIPRSSIQEGTVPPLQKADDATHLEPGTKVVNGYIIPKGCTVISKPTYAKPGTVSDVPIIHQRRYPKRNVPDICYTEEPLRAEDEYYYCPDCKTKNLGLICPEHGFLFRVKDKQVPKYCKDRAFRSLPNGLEIQESNIPTAGQGVFCDAWIPAHTILGPYEGKLIKNGNNDGGYCWEVERDERKNDCIDAEDMRYSNWTRFINAANHMEYQNLEPFQYKGQIFFRTNVDICYGDELYTWYGESYMSELGIDMVNYFKPKAKLHKMKGLVGNKCQFCFLNFTSLLVAQRHVHVRHGSEQSLLVIQYKATVMFPPSKYNMQQLVPASAYPAKRDENGLFACPVCGKTTKSNANLVRHIRIHTNERPFKCKFCTKAFTQPGHLKDHTMAAHTKERPHECSYCNASFTLKHVLTRHINFIHTHIKPYTCEDCDYSTAHKGNLTQHRQAVHLHVRNFACTECSYTSTTSSHFRAHMHIHTGDLFQCPSCDFKTAYNSSLNSHIKRMHP